MKNGLDKEIEVLKKIPAEMKLKMKIQLRKLKNLMSSLPRHGITQKTECKGTGSSIQKKCRIIKNYNNNNNYNNLIIRIIETWNTVKRPNL